MAALAARQPGSFCRVRVERPVELLKANSAGIEITKETIYTFQLVAYPNRKPVREAVAAGEREAPELPSHIAKSENAGNGLKFWIGKTGQVYLALPVFGDNRDFPVIWRRNKRKIAFDKIAKYLTANEMREVARSFTEKAVREAMGQAVARAVKIENVKEIL